MRNAVRDGSTIGNDGMMLIKGGAKRKTQHEVNADLEEEDEKIKLARQSEGDGTEPKNGKGKGKKRKQQAAGDDVKPVTKRKAAAKSRSSKRKGCETENPFETPLDEDQKKLTDLKAVKVSVAPKVKPESAEQPSASETPPKITSSGAKETGKDEHRNQTGDVVDDQQKQNKDRTIIVKIRQILL